MGIGIGIGVGTFGLVASGRLIEDHKAIGFGPQDHIDVAAKPKPNQQQKRTKMSKSNTKTEKRKETEREKKTSQILLVQQKGQLYGLFCNLTS